MNQVKLNELIKSKVINIPIYVLKILKEFNLNVDMVIMALGTSLVDVIAKTTPGLEINKRKCIVVDEVTGQTSRKEIFAGGDVTSGASTVILAMEAGKKAAKGIDEYLKSDE